MRRTTTALATAGALITMTIPARAVERPALTAELAGHDSVREHMRAGARALRKQRAATARARRRARVARRQARYRAARIPAALRAIGACESGGNPRAIGGGGAYRGKYQFSLGTWASVGGEGDPAAASEAEQDYRAALLYARAGSSPWPVCG